MLLEDLLVEVARLRAAGEVALSKELGRVMVRHLWGHGSKASIPVPSALVDRISKVSPSAIMRIYQKAS